MFEYLDLFKNPLVIYTLFPALSIVIFATTLADIIVSMYKNKRRKYSTETLEQLFAIIFSFIFSGFYYKLLGMEIVYVFYDTMMILFFSHLFLRLQIYRFLSYTIKKYIGKKLK